MKTSLSFITSFICGFTGGFIIGEMGLWYLRGCNNTMGTWDTGPFFYPLFGLPALLIHPISFGIFSSPKFKDMRFFYTTIMTALGYAGGITGIAWHLGYHG